MSPFTGSIPFSPQSHRDTEKGRRRASVPLFLLVESRALCQQIARWRQRFLPPSCPSGAPLFSVPQCLSDEKPVPFFVCCGYELKLSTTIAMPCPPPMQAVASPYFFFRRRSSYNNVITSRVPVAPSGCPSAIAPPFTFTLLRSRSSSFSTARYCPAKASLTSIRSMSSSFNPAFFSAAREAGTGPLPIILGSTPAIPQLTIRPIGLR